MNSNHSLSSACLIACLILAACSITSCNLVGSPGNEEQPDLAEGVVQAQFINQETERGVANRRVEVWGRKVDQGENEDPEGFGARNTDNDGRILVVLTHPDENVIKTLFFRIEFNDELHILEEEVALELRKGRDFDGLDYVDLVFELDPTFDPS